MITLISINRRKYIDDKESHEKAINIIEERRMPLRYFMTWYVIVSVGL